jgi:N-acetylmuramoyl-L-alanine amidase
LLIYLDAGHGGTDGGASGNGLKEKDLTLDICKRILEGLKSYDNCTVMMSRSDDSYPTLDQRTKEANNANADILLSVHINSAAPTARGFESHIYTHSDAGTKAYQNVMHEQILKSMGSGITDRGKKQSNFHMLRESKMKAILTENLFISNSADAKLLGDPDFRQKIAQGHINGLERFLGLKKSSQPPPTATKPAGKLYRVQVGAFEDKDNADALAADLLKQGYRPIVKYE